MATAMHIVSAPDDVREKAPAIVSVHGPVDVSAGIRLLVELGRLMDTGTDRYVVDLSEASSFGATGLAALLTIQRRAAAVGGWVRLVGPPPAILEYLTSAVSPLPFVIHASVEDATA